METEQESPSKDDRLARLEREWDRLKPSLTDRIESLEYQIGKRKSSGRLAWIGQALTPIISGLVIMVFGYFLKDSVDQAIARQRLELGYAKEMQMMILEMNKRDATRNQIDAAALVLATFGEHAVVPLMNALQDEGSNRALAADKGLRALALTGKERTCDVLQEVLTNRTRQYLWQTHRRVIKLLGELNCQDALSVLNNYQGLISEAELEPGLSAYRSVVRRDSLPDRDSIRQIREALESTLELLAGSGKSAGKG
jgi:hypothetical protein